MAPRREIVAIPAPTPHRRVNVGMANVGNFPATFRLSVTSADGRQIGGVAESGAPEDYVWVINNVEHQLGVTLDETMTLRITVIAGTGVAYASVIDAEGNTNFIPATPTQQQKKEP